jgi:hypothetical protein
MRHPTRYIEAKAREFVALMEARDGRVFRAFRCTWCGCWHVRETS